jgi:hypothetical protein
MGLDAPLAASVAAFGHYGQADLLAALPEAFIPSVLGATEMITAAASAIWRFAAKGAGGPAKRRQAVDRNEIKMCAYTFYCCANLRKQPCFLRILKNRFN